MNNVLEPSVSTWRCKTIRYSYKIPARTFHRLDNIGEFMPCAWNTSMFNEMLFGMFSLIGNPFISILLWNYMEEKQDANMHTLSLFRCSDMRNWLKALVCIYWERERQNIAIKDQQEWISTGIWQLFNGMEISPWQNNAIVVLSLPILGTSDCSSF